MLFTTLMWRGWSTWLPLQRHTQTLWTPLTPLDYPFILCIRELLGSGEGGMSTGAAV